MEFKKALETLKLLENAKIIKRCRPGNVFELPAVRSAEAAKQQALCDWLIKQLAQKRGKRMARRSEGVSIGEFAASGLARSKLEAALMQLCSQDISLLGRAIGCPTGR